MMKMQIGEKNMKDEDEDDVEEFPFCPKSMYRRGGGIFFFCFVFVFFYFF